MYTYKEVRSYDVYTGYLQGTPDRDDNPAKGTKMLNSPEIIKKIYFLWLK